MDDRKSRWMPEIENDGLTGTQASAGTTLSADTTGSAGTAGSASMIDEVDDDDRRWDASFARSQDLLRRMAAKALDDFNAGRTEPLDPDTL
jgi:hypothetical protein